MSTYRWTLSCKTLLLSCWIEKYWCIHMVGLRVSKFPTIFDVLEGKHEQFTINCDVINRTDMLTDNKVFIAAQRICANKLLQKFQISKIRKLIWLSVYYFLNSETTKTHFFKFETLRLHSCIKWHWWLFRLLVSSICSVAIASTTMLFDRLLSLTVGINTRQRLEWTRTL